MVLLHFAHSFPRKPRWTVASLTSKLLPMKSLLFSMETALRASHWVDISTKANPLRWPVCLSLTMLTDMTSPAREKRVFSSGSVASTERLATYIFLLILVFLLIDFSLQSFLYFLKHSIHNKVLSSGGGTWSIITFPHPAQTTL